MNFLNSSARVSTRQAAEHAERARARQPAGGPLARPRHVGPSGRAAPCRPKPGGPEAGRPAPHLAARGRSRNRGLSVVAPGCGRALRKGRSPKPRGGPSRGPFSRQARSGATAPPDQPSRPALPSVFFCFLARLARPAQSRQVRWGPCMARIWAWGPGGAKTKDRPQGAAERRRAPPRPAEPRWRRRVQRESRGHGDQGGRGGPRVCPNDRVYENPFPGSISCCPLF